MREDVVMPAVADPPIDRTGTRLLGVLLVHLSRREDLHRMLEDLEDLPREELVEELVGEFEAIVSRRRLERLVERDLERDHRRRILEKPVPVPPPPAARQPVPPVVLPPPAAKVPEAVVEPPVAPAVIPVMTSTPPPRDLPIPSLTEPETEVPETIMKSPKHEPHGKERSERAKKPGKSEAARERSHIQPKEEPVPVERHHPRTNYDFKEEGVYYLHGFTQLPAAESPADRPFMLEEKGIEGEFAFAVDRGGMRFYISALRAYAPNVTKHGVLLLNKQESIRLRGTHASILNELRAHGTLMPFAFGSVVAGREELLRKIDAHTWELRQAIQDQVKTSWWDLSVYALDSRIGEFLTPEGMSGRRERDRGRESYTVGQSGQKLDIKALEKILGKEKKLAEGIHEELSPIADRADVDMMVGLNSGTSDDWKLILKSSYELPASRVQWFCRTLTELQYRHFIYELMLVFDGAREPFTFKGI